MEHIAIAMVNTLEQTFTYLWLHVVLEPALDRMEAPGRRARHEAAARAAGPTSFCLAAEPL